MKGGAVLESAPPPAAQPDPPTSRPRPRALTLRIVGAAREMPPELHLDDVRVFVPSGRAVVAIGSVAARQVVQPPQVCVVPPGERLHVQLDPGSEAVLAALGTLACEERAIRVQGRPARVESARVAVDSKLREGVEALAHDLRGGKLEAGDARGDDLALHVASAYGAIKPASACAGLSRPRLERVLHLIDERLAFALPVSELADAVHLSPFHFSRMFRVSTGRSPHEWIMLKRMACAKALLAGTRMPLPEVARASGYRTHSHFSGMFHAVVGMTPGQYRARHAAPAA
jgi:AraC family transcriptional regulator